MNDDCLSCKNVTIDVPWHLILKGILLLRRTEKTKRILTFETFCIVINRLVRYE